MPTTLAETSEAKNATIKLSASDRAHIKSIATFRKRTPHYIMKEAITLYIEKEMARQHFIAGALRAREDMKKTGLHITGEEFSAWVQNIKNNPNTPMPVCHV
jgi:predicted transcriptional regulator